MKRLRDLEIHEVSLVGVGANRKKFNVIKNKEGKAMGVKPQDLLNLLTRIPKERVEAIEHVAKSAKLRVAKSDGDDADGALDAGMSENAQNAIKAAGRILAPYADQLTPDVMDMLADALGLDGAEEDMTDEAADDAQDAADDVADDAADAGVTKADDDKDVPENFKKSDDDDDKDSMAKSDDTDDDKKKGEVPANFQKSDDDDKKDDADAMKKSADVTDEKDLPDSLKKADDDKGLSDMEAPLDVKKADGMPDFADADDADIEAGMAAARQAYANAMKERGKKEATAKSDDSADVEDEDKDVMKSAVAKSALASLKGLPEAQRKILEPVLKSQFSAMAALQSQHREAVKKSANLEAEVKRREFVAKAAREYAHMGPAEEIGEQLLRLHQKDPEGVASFERILKAANAQAMLGGADTLFGELGTRMSNQAGGDADAKIKAHVDSVVQKSAGGKTREQIERDFLQTPAGRALYQQVRNN